MIISKYGKFALIFFQKIFQVAILKYQRDIESIKKLGNRIREIRLSKKLSQEALSYKAEIEYSQISRIERGVINTSVSQVFTIAKALNVKPHELFMF